MKSFPRLMVLAAVALSAAGCGMDSQNANNPNVNPADLNKLNTSEQPAPSSGSSNTSMPVGDPKKLATTPSGLQYEDIVIGTGPSPQSGQKVKVHYTGWLANGQKFDSSVDRNEPFEFTIGQQQVIKGWDEGVATMKVGGTRKLVIPPALGYGAAGAGGTIPPNSTLVFKVELLGVQ